MEIERDIAGYVVKELLNRKMPMTFTEFCETINKRLNGPVDSKNFLIILNCMKAMVKCLLNSLRILVYVKFIAQRVIRVQILHAVTFISVSSML